MDAFQMNRRQHHYLGTRLRQVVQSRTVEAADRKKRERFGWANQENDLPLFTGGVRQAFRLRP